MTLDFEGTGTFPFNSNWTVGTINNNNALSLNTSYKHSGSNCAQTNGGGGTLVTYKNKLTNIKSVSVWVSKTSKNNTSSPINIQYSSDNQNWETKGSIDFTDTKIISSAGVWVELTAEINANGYIRITKSGSGTAVRLIDDITIEYGDDQPKTTTTLSWSANTCNATIGDAGNTYPTLTITPADLTGVTYSSSKTDVATIDANGAITLVAAGTTTIKASYAGNETYAPAEDATYTLNVAAAPAAKYAVTIVSPENGTLTIKNGDATVNNGDEVEEGTVLTIIPDAAAGYRFKNWGYKDGDANWVGNNTSTFTHVMPSAPCSFRATFDQIPTYTVAFSVNGTNVQSETYEEGTLVTAPNVNPINGKVFTGWVTTPSVDASSTPDYVIPSIAKKDVTYYAVFASENGGAESWNKVIDASKLQENDVIAIVSSEAVGYNIKGNTTKYEGYIALGKTQNNNNRAGVVVSVENDVLTMNDDVQQITLTKGTFDDNNSVGQTGWQLGVDGGYLYASSSSSNQLKTQETNNIDGLWNISINEEGKATIYAEHSKNRNYMRINGNYQNNTSVAPLVAAYSSTSTTGVLASIYKKSGGVSYSNFATLVDTYSRGTTTGKYGTVCLPTTFEVEGATVYSVSGVNNDVVVLEEVTEVTAGAPYLYQATANAQTFTLTGNSVAVPQNSDYLTGVFEPTKMTVGNYVLQTQEGVQGFYKVTETNNLTSPAYRCYLNGDQVPNGVKAFYFDGNATAIKAIETLTSGNAKIYDLNGRQQKTLQKGVNIVNGVKFIVK